MTMTMISPCLTFGMELTYVSDRVPRQIYLSTVIELQ